jgi:spore coat polysaccharide biosynthesis protein SpsF
MLRHIIERLKDCPAADGLMIATSTETSDDPLAALVADAAVGLYRGALDDVLDRMIGAAHAAGADAIVRISGDSPLIDVALVAAAIQLWRTMRTDLVTNVRERTFPKGQSVEVIAVAALEQIRGLADTQEREHVTQYFYRHPAEFRIIDIRRQPPCGDLQLSVDTQEDFSRAAKILDRLGRPYETHGLEAIISAARALEGSGN